MRYGAYAVWATTVAAAAGLSLLVPPGTSRADLPAAATAASALSLQPPPATAPNSGGPLYLQNDDVPETVYAEPGPPREDQGVNAGGVNLDLRVSYLTDYVYRGIDKSEMLAADPGDEGPGEVIEGSEDAPNLQVAMQIEFNLGRAPHPFAGVFANVFDDDPVSRFQEIRPFFGLEWSLRPFVLAAGHTTYIYPEREDLNTAEVWASVTLDDSVLWGTDEPVLSPYVYAAYDYDIYDGLYVEAGVKHSWDIEDTGVTLTVVGDVAYVFENPQFSANFTGIADLDESGFQHYQVGLIGTYSLNRLLNIPARYGQFDLEGYLYYTDSIDDDLRADTQIWGGAGIGFHY